MSADIALHSHQDKHNIGTQYAKAYKALVALGGDKEATVALIDFFRKLEMHHVDSIESLREIHASLRYNAEESDRWHNEMNEMNI